MIDRLQNMFPQVEQLPPEAQEELATYLEALIAVLERKTFTSQYLQQTLLTKQGAEFREDLFGVWKDLPDDMLDELDRIRHSNPPTPPIEDL